MKYKITIPTLSLLTILICFSSNSLAQKTSVIKKWKVYSDANISFKYPPNFILKKTKAGIDLYHVSKLKHRDPCGEDDSDNDINLTHLEDFRLNFRFTNNLEKLNNSEDEVTKDEWEKISQGLIDTGNLKGEAKLEAVEGCGNIRYSFPISDSKKTLIIERAIISLFQPVTYQDEKAIKKAKLSKTILKPNDEERIFKMIIESIKIK